MSEDQTKYSILGNVNIQHNAYSRLAQFELIFKIQSHYNFRTIEILRLNNSSLYPDDNILIKLAKCEEFEFIRDAEIWNELNTVFTHTENHCFEVSYKEYYSYFCRFKKHHIIKGHTKTRKVTHSFRYVRAKLLKARTDDKKIIKAGLHHQSIKSQEYYLKSKPKQSKR
jgi:hypothetical protein